MGKSKTGRLWAARLAHDAFKPYASSTGQPAPDNRLCISEAYRFHKNPVLDPLDTLG
jgi:hypothetical protein